MQINNGDLRKIEDTAQFLLDTGLLFEINRKVLHPFGLALEIVVSDDTGEAKVGKLWDYRDDPEGMLFAPETFEAGLDKWFAFLKDNKDSLKERLEILGYMFQGETQCKAEWVLTLS